MGAPIQAQHHEVMNALAAGIDDILNGEVRPKKNAFVLLMAEFGVIENGRINYISNADRADIVAMLKEYLARIEGRYSDGGNA